MVYVILADGFEEIEAIEPIDIMRRAGIEVVTAALKNKIVTGAHNIPITADITIDEIEPEKMELLMLPGGAGHELLDASNEVHGLLNYAASKDIYIASICAAPSILGKKMMLEGKKATCFPGFEKYLYGAEIVADKAVADGNFITARGAGAASDFGFLLVELLAGRDSADELRKTMQYE